jgi:hypothetical protein
MNLMAKLKIHGFKELVLFPENKDVKHYIVDVELSSSSGESIRDEVRINKQYNMFNWGYACPQIEEFDLKQGYRLSDTIIQWAEKVIKL